MELQPQHVRLLQPEPENEPDPPHGPAGRVPIASPPPPPPQQQQQQKRLPLALVQAGDLFQVVPGDRIPVDGVVLRGHTAVDEAMLTGEAALVVNGGQGAVLGGGRRWTGTELQRAGPRSCHHGRRRRQRLPIPWHEQTLAIGLIRAGVAGPRPGWTTILHECSSWTG